MINAYFVPVYRWENGNFESTKLQKERLKEMFKNYKIDLDNE